MGYLRDEDYDDLPVDDSEAFARLEAISRERLYAEERDQDGDIRFEDMLRYMNEVAALAEQFAITEISYDAQPDTHYSHEFARFTRAVDYRLAQIRVRRSRRNQRDTVAITGAARIKIQHHLEKLKAEVEAANLPDKRKKALLSKIADFEAELTKSRINLAAVMTVVALVSSVVHDNVETLIDSPKIVQAISAVLGTAKADEEECASQILTKPEVYKSIPDMRTKPASAKIAGGYSGRGFGDDLDDDVPF